MLLALTVSARPLQAQCGDWLDHTQTASPTAVVTHQAADTLGLRLPPWTPCRGPNCRRAPQAPAPTPASRSVTLSRDVDWIGQPGGPVPTALAAGIARHHGLLICGGHPLRIERPPRG